MRTRSAVSALGSVAVLATLVAAISAPAQVPTPARPVDAIPRMADGRPDFSGIWQVLATAAWNLEDHHAEKGAPGGQGVVEGSEIPYQPGALVKRNDNYRNRATADPLSNCYLPGVPRIMYMPFPFQVFQTPSYLALTFEFVHAVRHIYINSEHLEGPIEWWMGDSRARWDGDTLVVDVRHFNADTWLDAAGNHHSEEMHLVERYTFIDRDHINYEVTVEDPKVFSRPWKMRMPLYRRIESNIQILDYECHAFDELGFATGSASVVRDF